MSQADKVFGSNLKRMRKQKRISQQRFAESVGVSQRTVSHYERGESQPTLECLCRIADSLETSVDELLGRTPQQPRENDPYGPYDI